MAFALSAASLLRYLTNPKPLLAAVAGSLVMVTECTWPAQCHVIGAPIKQSGKKYRGADQKHR